MATVEFIVSDAQIRDLRRVLDPKELRSALYNAVKRTTNRARTIAADAVLERMTIPKKYVVGTNRRAAITTSVSTKSESPEGRLNVKSIPLPLSAFQYFDTGRFGVDVVIDTKRAPLHLRHAFVRKVASLKQLDQGVSHLAVLTRSKVSAERMDAYLQSNSSSKLITARNQRITPKGYSWRLPIEEKLGPRVIDFITQDEIRAAVETKIGNELEHQIDSQVSRFTEGRFNTLGDAVAALDIAEQVEDRELVNA